MSTLTRFRSLTVQFYVPGIAAGVEFYTRTLGRPPNFAPYPDFHEWDHIAPNVTIQIAEGTPRPTYPIRLGVPDIDAERERIAREADPAFTSPIKRLEGLVATCDFIDPWGNTFGLYQVLFTGEPPVLEGFGRDQRTEVETRIASSANPPNAQPQSTAPPSRGRAGLPHRRPHRDRSGRPGDRRICRQGRRTAPPPARCISAALGTSPAPASSITASV